MSWAIRLGRIAGIEVRIHITFFLLLAWVGLWQSREEGARMAVHWMLFMCLVFLCVLLHEFGHALAARRYGIRTPDITLYPFGGVARIERIPDNPRQEVVIAVMGPLVNVVIAGVLFIILAAQGRLANWYDGGVSGTLAGQLMMVNAMLVAFNMLPAFPMDGGRVLRALLATRMEHARATRIAARIGQALALGLAMIGMFGHFLGLPQNPMLIIVAMFVFIAAANEAGAAQLQSMSRGLRVSEAMITEFKALPRNASLGEAADLLLQTSQREFPVVDPDGALRGIFTRNDLVAALRQSGPDAPVLGVMREDVPVVNPGTPFDEAYALMNEREGGVLPVTDAAGRLVGLLTLENIGELMLVRGAIAESRRKA